MAATMFSLVAQQTSRFAAVALRQQLSAISSRRSIFLSSRLLAGKRYTEKHEWIELQGSIGTVGISNYAQESLGEIVYVQLPDIGAQVDAGGEAGCLESVKAASDVYSPVSGKITEVNDALTETPKLINSSPLDKGWIFRLKVADKGEVDALMDEDAYKTYLETKD